MPSRDGEEELGGSTRRFTSGVKPRPPGLWTYLDGVFDNDAHANVSVSGHVQR
jgi:hypothetical protein